MSFLTICLTLFARYSKYGNEKLDKNWKFKAMLRRMWTWIGFNGLLRIIILQYMMVLFAFYITNRKQVILLQKGELNQMDLSVEVLTVSFFTIVLAVVLLSLPFLSKKKLRHPYLESCISTVYYKANLSSVRSKAYPLLLML